MFAVSGENREQPEGIVDSYLHELYAHQEWADAVHWRALEEHAAALEDKAIRERLLHIHLVQHGFLWVTGPMTEGFAFRKLEDFASMADLKAYARGGNTALRDLLKATDDARMEELVEIPWFPKLKLSRRHAFTQAAMHSHYHRGQNATRLRELGGVPPHTDFIVWLKDGKPAAKWE
jgi:uncharacterized damage-inducible protein DinB